MDTPEVSRRESKETPKVSCEEFKRTSKVSCKLFRGSCRAKPSEDTLGVPRKEIERFRWPVESTSNEPFRASKIKRDRQYLVPTEDLPLHEIICFRNVSSLQQAMTGATRQKVQLDLLGSQLRLQCECCHPDGSLSNSMHDTCLAYHLSQEHNELINVHDWYQSFSSICCPAKASGGKKGKGKKSEGSVVDPVTIQARCARAATELQIAGLLRMPKKGRPDFAQRVCLN